MDILKKYFPVSFGATDVVKLVIKIIIYVVIGAIVTCLGAIISLVPFAGGVIAGILGTLSSVYCLIGIVLVVLDFLKILK
jgi:hypothetical protein